MGKQQQELLTALSSLHLGGKYSDLTIKCNSREWRVHRAILCSRSTFFDGACSSQFLEAKTGVIDLSDDDDEAVDHMINYFYHLDYLPTESSSQLPADNTTQTGRGSGSQAAPLRKLSLAASQDPLFAQAAVHAPPTPVASPNGTRASTGQTSVREQLQSDANLTLKVRTSVDPSQKRKFRIASEAEDESEEDLEYDSDDSHLLTHTRVYALAEKYGVVGLKSLACEKFEVAMACYYDSPEFPDAVEEVYNSTIDGDRGLRNIVLQAFRNHPQLANTQDVYTIIKNTPSLAFELWKTERGLPV